MKYIINSQENVQDNLRKATILLGKIQQMEEQVDALLCDIAEEMIKRISTASAEQIPALKLELQNFPSAPFWRCEIRTALIMRETVLSSTTPNNHS